MAGRQSGGGTDEHRDESASQARASRPGRLVRLCGFMAANRKQWLAAVVLVLMLVGALVALSPATGTGESGLVVLWGLVLLNFLWKDNFPFSRFTMYATLRDFVDYEYLTNELDRPIPTRDFLLSASTLRKLYHSNIDGGWDLEWFRRRTAEELAPDGRKVLGLLLARAQSLGVPVTCRRLRLYQVNVEYRQGTVHQRKLLIAEVPVC